MLKNKPNGIDTHLVDVLADGRLQPGVLGDLAHDAEVRPLVLREAGHEAELRDQADPDRVGQLGPLDVVDEQRLLEVADLDAVLLLVVVDEGVGLAVLRGEGVGRVRLEVDVVDPVGLVVVARDDALAEQGFQDRVLVVLGVLLDGIDQDIAGLKTRKN